MTDTHEKLKKYESTIRSHVECEEKAFHIVNNLIDGKVEGSYLIKCGQLISKEHYRDVVEERAISSLCGYPLCDNALKDIPGKQYHISLKTNRVYDISERKNFCSNQCFKASKHFSNQISESPLWTRAKEPATDIQLIAHVGIRGMIGDELVGISPKKLLEDEIKQLEAMDIRSSKPSKNSKETATSEKENPKSSNMKKDTIKLTGSQKNGGSFPTARGDNTEVLSGVIDSGLLESTVSVPRESEVKEPGNTLERESNFVGADNKNSTTFITRASHLPQSKEKATPEQVEISISSNDIPTSDKEKFQEPDISTMRPQHKTTQSTFESNSSKDMKMDHLLKLLSSKKSALVGMLDIVTAAEPCNKLATTQISTPTVSSLSDLIPSMKATDIQCQNQYSPAPDTQSHNQSSPLWDYQNHSQPSLAQNPENHLSITKDTQTCSQLYQAQNLPQTPSNILYSKSLKLGRKSRPVSKSPLVLICAVLKTWITKETTAYICSSATEGNSETPRSFSDPVIQRGYADLCQRLDAQQKDFEDLVNEPGDCGDMGRALKTTPDYNALKKEAEEFQLRITEFITGKKPQTTSKKDGGDDTVMVYIPTVDACDQLQIRKKIVLERLDKFIPDLLVPLGLTVQDVSTLIRELVYTFKLEKDTIVFRPSEWTLVSVFILKMLGKKNKTIASAFGGKLAVQHFSILLKAIGHSLADLEELTEDILTM